MLFSTFAIASLVTLVSAAPTAIEKRWPSIPRILRPSVISRYEGFNGAITYNVARGEASKSGNGRDISALVTFDNTNLDLPATCELRFFLDATDANVQLSGTQQVAIFSSLKPAPAAGSTGWGPPGNQRNEDLGRFSLVRGGDGTLIAGQSTKVRSFPCPRKGAGPIGFEVVPLGDRDRVEWSANLSGLYITWA